MTHSSTPNAALRGNTPRRLAGLVWRVARAVVDVPALALIVLIRVYQLTLSKMLGPVCRFEPSCSRYAAECLASHGALKGSWLALRRLLRCHPFHPGGYDPPPAPRGRIRRSGLPRGLLEAARAPAVHGCLAAHSHEDPLPPS